MILGILLALAMMMICSMFGISIVIVAPICAILAAVTGGDRSVPFLPLLQEEQISSIPILLRI